MAIVPTYFWPVATPGTTTPALASAAPPTNPTSSVRYNEVVAEITNDATATSVVITHNLGITATELTQLWPEVRFEPIVSGAPSFWVIARAANTVTIGISATSAATVPQAIIRIRRPFGPTR